MAAVVRRMSLPILAWVAIGIAGASLLLSAATLIIAWRVLKVVDQSKRAGDERLEILREQQNRLDYMHKERRLLEEVLEMQRQAMEESSRQLELPAPPEPERPKPWWRRWFAP